jgi:exonuclease-1
LDQNGGGILIEQEKIHLSMNMQPEQFNMDKFRYMCILSGCDYLPSIPGIGLMKARQFISRSSEPDIYKVIFDKTFILIFYRKNSNKISIS